MKKTLLTILALSLISLTAEAQTVPTPTVQTTYNYQNVPQAALAATLAAASSQTPAGQSFQSESSFKNAQTGNYTVVAIYR